MHPIARKLLRKLLQQVDRGGRPSIAVTERSAREYFRLTDHFGRDDVHAALANAEAAGAITLDWGRGAASRDLVRIRLADADRLAHHLGEPRAAKLATDIEREARPSLDGAPDWLRVAFAEALGRWGRGQTAFATHPAESQTALGLFRVAAAVARGEQTGLDLRRFSVRLLGDSKAVERLLKRLADLLRCNPDWADLDDDGELFQALGLQKFPPAVFLKGPLLLRYGLRPGLAEAEGDEPGPVAGASGGLAGEPAAGSACDYAEEETSAAGIDWDISRLRPFVAFAPDAVTEVRITQPPPYVLSVENLASFQRHVREVPDQGIVLYTAGFPSPALAGFIGRIDRALPDTCPFFHWGDRDPAGLRIFRAVAGACPRHHLRPHLMDETASESRPFTAAELGALRRMAGVREDTATIAQRWLSTELGRLEQEALDPAKPAEGGAWLARSKDR